MYIRVQLLEKMSNLRSDRLVIPLYTHDEVVDAEW